MIYLSFWHVFVLNYNDQSQTQLSLLSMFEKIGPSNTPSFHGNSSQQNLRYVCLELFVFFFIEFWFLWLVYILHPRSDTILVVTRFILVEVVLMVLDTVDAAAVALPWWGGRCCHECRLICSCRCGLWGGRWDGCLSVVWWHTVLQAVWENFHKLRRRTG